MADMPLPVETTTSQQATKLEDLPVYLDQSTCVRRGLCPVMTLGPDKTMKSHSLYYEIHGTGKEKIVFIMGVNAPSSAWEYQVPYFAKHHTVLVFDNRGVGNSDAPEGRYKSSQMAEDVIALFEYLGWGKTRELHIVGSSLGGMIGQELAPRIPEKILSLSLLTTASGSAGFIANRLPWKGVKGFFSVATSKDDNYKADVLFGLLYPDSWLDAQSEEAGKTNRDIVKASLVARLAASRPQPPNAAMSQMACWWTHHVSASKLAQIANTVPKIFILTGDDDSLIKPVNSDWLHQCMPGSELIVWKGFGHGLIAQDSDGLNVLLERVVKEGRERGNKAPWI